MNLSMFSIWKWHQQNVVKIATIKKIGSISIWMVGMPRMCHTINTIVGNLFFFLHHQDKGHLQFFTSIGCQQYPASSHETKSIYVYTFIVIVKNRSSKFTWDVKLSIFSPQIGINNLATSINKGRNSFSSYSATRITTFS
jgi:hypothetical protein